MKRLIGLLAACVLLGVGAVHGCVSPSAAGEPPIWDSYRVTRVGQVANSVSEYRFADGVRCYVFIAFTNMSTDCVVVGE